MSCHPMFLSCLVSLLVATCLVVSQHYSKEFKELLIRVWCSDPHATVNGIANEYNVPESTFRGWIKRVETYGTIDDTRTIVGFESRGRPRSLNFNDLTCIFESIAHDPTLYYDELNDILQGFGGTVVSDETVRVSIHRLGLTRKIIARFD